MPIHEQNDSFSCQDLFISSLPKPSLVKQTLLKITSTFLA